MFAVTINQILNAVCGVAKNIKNRSLLLSTSDLFKKGIRG